MFINERNDRRVHRHINIVSNLGHVFEMRSIVIGRQMTSSLHDRTSRDLEIEVIRAYERESIDAIWTCFLFSLTDTRRSIANLDTRLVFALLYRLIVLPPLVHVWFRR